MVVLVKLFINSSGVHRHLLYLTEIQVSNWDISTATEQLSGGKSPIYFPYGQRALLQLGLALSWLNLQYKRLRAVLEKIWFFDKKKKSKEKELKIMRKLQLESVHFGFMGQFWMNSATAVPYFVYNYDKVY